MNGKFYGAKVLSSVYSLELSEKETLGLSHSDSEYHAGLAYTTNYSFSTSTGEFKARFRFK